MSDRFNEGLEQGIQLGMLKERERIISALGNKETAKTLIILAENTRPEHPKEIQNSAWVRIAAVIKGEQK